MRQGQQSRRGRGRGRKTQNTLSRNLESNGPDVKIRGTASHIAEKYQGLARDAQASGDPITAENYLQHAEHYQRMIMAAQTQQGNAAQPDMDDAPQHSQRADGGEGGRRSSNAAARANDGEGDHVARANSRGPKRAGNGADTHEEAAANGSGAAVEEEAAEGDASTEAPSA